MLFHVGDFVPGHGAESLRFGYTDISDDDIDGGDIKLGLKRLDGGRGVGLGGAVDFLDDKGAEGVSGKGGEGSDGGVFGVAKGSDDGRVGTG